MKTFEKILITALMICSILIFYSIDIVLGIRDNNLHKQYIYKENQIKEEFKDTDIPNCKIKRMIFNEKFRLIECKNEQFYIMNKVNNSIDGPMNEAESMKKFEEYLDIDLIEWEKQN